MAVSGQRRIALFVAAIAVPCLVLVVLGLRMIAQEGELAEKRLAEDRRRLVSQIRQEMLARLESIRLREISAWAMKRDANAAGDTGAANSSDPLVALVGGVVDGHLVLPWENNNRTQEFQSLFAASVYAERISNGEEAELAQERPDKAVRFYQQAIKLARHPAQTVYGQLLLARALVKSDRQGEARLIYERLLSLSSAGTTDESGVPVWLYAAERLFHVEGRNTAILDRVSSEMASGPRFSPAGAYLLSGLLNELANSASDPTIRQTAERLKSELSPLIRDLEQALALERDFPNLGLSRIGIANRHQPESLWIPYGEDTWLVSIATSPVGGGSILVAVHAEGILNWLNESNLRLDDQRVEVGFAAEGGGGEVLGEAFPGLRVVLRVSDEMASDKSWSTQRGFYLTALMLVLSVTVFAAYLLWRDVQRDLRLADLRSQFVASVSHELKTPLTSIRMFAETLRYGRVPERRVEVEYLETIISESERLTRLLNNLLDFSKVEQGKKSYHMRATSLVDVARVSVQALEHSLAQQGFELRLDLEADLPAVNADPDSLEQAILNLLTNAMKYSGESRRISLSLARRNGDAVIEVGDSGLGIAAEEQRRVFDEFYRGAAPEIGMIAGTGLGLTLVAHIAKAHGGRVEVESEPGKGSIFSIHLPLEIES